MNLQMRKDIAEVYHSNSQKIRVMTEDWFNRNMYCPYCGRQKICHFQNNRPVADYFCPDCGEEYELKSKGGAFGRKINDGAYSTMITRIQASNNPNFFFLQYSQPDFRVKNVMMVPKYFFLTEMIEKRKPLREGARRAGWIGCNIIMEQIPDEGKIYIIKNEMPILMEEVIEKVQRTRFIAEYKLDARGWILDIFHCIERIPNKDFTLDEVYQFADELAVRHPNNHHIKEKIRQQLQLLRDKGLIEFRGGGTYRKR